MAIKWICDLCEHEITKPEYPVVINTYHCVKNRDDFAVGYGESNDVIKVLAHRSCAETLATEIRSAVTRAQEVIKNNAS